MTHRRRVVLTTVSAAVAIVALGLWIWNFDVSTAEVADLFHRLRWWTVFPLAALLAGHVALSSRRWQLIEDGLGAERPRFGPAYATGTFALGLGAFLPSPLVNVLSRALANRHAGVSSLRGALSGGLDQLSDLVIVLLLSGPALAAFLAKDLKVYLWGGAGTLIAGAAITFVIPWLLRILPFGIVRRIRPLFRWSLLSRLYGLSTLRVLNLTLMNILICQAVGAGSVSAVLIAVPLVMLATSITMLPGAIGVSEWSFSGIFSGMGISDASIIVFVLGNRILLTILSLSLALIALAATSFVLTKKARASGTGEQADW